MNNLEENIVNASFFFFFFFFYFSRVGSNFWNLLQQEVIEANSISRYRKVFKKMLGKKS